MTVPLWCLVAVTLLPYLLAGVADYLRKKQFGRIDNRDPRGQSALLEGAGARAWAAQQNAWEALPLFTVCVLVAHVTGVEPVAATLPAVAFVVARVAHMVFYLADLSTLRSLSFLVGVVACVRLIVLAASA